MDTNTPIYYTDKYQCNTETFDTYPGEIFLRISDCVPEADFPPYMFISNYGRLYNAYLNRLCKVTTYLTDGDNKKYARISNGKRTFSLHRIQLSCFGENHLFDMNLEPDHINGIKNDNRINLFNQERNNLEWVTRRENICRAYDNGLSKLGEDNVHSNITEETATKVIELLATSKYTSKQIINIIGDSNLTTSIVDDIRKKQSWTRQSEGYEFHQRINRQFNEDDIHHFCQSFQRLYREGSALCINDKCRIALSDNGFEPTDKYVETLRKIYVKKYYPKITSQYIW